MSAGGTLGIFVTCTEDKSEGAIPVHIEVGGGNIVDVAILSKRTKRRALWGAAGRPGAAGRCEQSMGNSEGWRSLRVKAINICVHACAHVCAFKGVVRSCGGGEGGRENRKMQEVRSLLLLGAGWEPLEAAELRKVLV